MREETRAVFAFRFRIFFMLFFCKFYFPKKGGGENFLNHSLHPRQGDPFIEPKKKSIFSSDKVGDLLSGDFDNDGSLLSRERQRHVPPQSHAPVAGGSEVRCYRGT